MSEILFRNMGENRVTHVTDLHPFPVAPQLESGQSILERKIPLSADISWLIALSGLVYIAGDGDQNDRVTGATSFANTTPTFMLRNPATSDRLIFPYFYQLAQTGSVAGGDIAVETELVSPDAYASGGTSERVRNAAVGMSGAPVNKGLLFSGATATAGYGIACGHATLAPDVSPAEGVINIYEWQAPTGCILWPGSSLNVFTHAGTTGPTWGWHFSWAEVPLEWLS